jgi:hypothetical protein
LKIEISVVKSVNNIGQNRLFLPDCSSGSGGQKHDRGKQTDVLVGSGRSFVHGTPPRNLSLLLLLLFPDDDDDDDEKEEEEEMPSK